MSKNLTQQFDSLLSQYTATIENNFLLQLKKAKNKEFVQGAILNQARAVMRFYSVAISKHNKAFNYFIEKYKRGEAIENILSKIKSDYPETMKIIPEVDEGDKIELIPFGKEEEALLKEFPMEMRELISFHAGYLAFDEITKRIPGYLNQGASNITISKKQKSDLINWTAPKDAKNDFVQVVYALHLAGFINNGKGEIIKITESLAETFGIELSKNWQSNHSASIHKSNADYSPPIFDKMKDAYLKYSKSKQREKDK